jgi:hypothetical protein
MRRSRAFPQGEVIRQLTPTMRGWAPDERLGVSQAVSARLDARPWAKLRSGAHRRPPTTPTPGVLQRYWHRRGPRLTCAPATRRLRMPGPSIPLVRSPSPGIAKAGAPAVPLRGSGSRGAGDGDGTQESVRDWRGG